MNENQEQEAVQTALIWFRDEPAYARVMYWLIAGFYVLPRLTVLPDVVEEFLERITSRVLTRMLERMLRDAGERGFIDSDPERTVS